MATSATSAAATMQQPSPGLSLSISATPAVAVAPSTRSLGGMVKPSPPRPFDAPGSAEIRELTPEHPMVRLNTRQSAVGSLLVTGATTVVWESSERVTGSESISGAIEGTVVFTSGNRPLVCLADGRVLLTLRHVSQLRRALIFGEEANALAVQLYGGVLGLPPSGPGLRNVLLVSRVGRQLELRSDPMPISIACDDIPKVFGFKMSVSFPSANERL